MIGYNELLDRYGNCAATTYTVLVQHDCSEEYAHSIAQWQVDVLGKGYSGNLCGRYRKAYPVELGGNGEMRRDEIEGPTYRLSNQHHALLCDALREYTWDQAYPKYSYGLGINLPVACRTPRQVKTAVDREYVKRQHQNVDEAAKQWYVLGEMGKRIILYWDSLGYCYQSMSVGIMPPKENANVH